MVEVRGSAVVEKGVVFMRGLRSSEAVTNRKAGRSGRSESVVKLKPNPALKRTANGGAARLLHQHWQRRRLPLSWNVGQLQKVLGYGCTN